MDEIVMPGRVRALRAFGVAVCVLAGMVGCATRAPDFLYVDPRAQPLTIELRKHLGSRYQPVAISECVFYEAPKSGEADAVPYPQEIWRVISVASDRPVVGLRYGIVPPGFLQSTPVGAAARPLLPGHHYTAQCSGDTNAASEFVIPEVATRPGVTRPPDDRQTYGSRP